MLLCLCNVKSFISSTTTDSPELFSASKSTDSTINSYETSSTTILPLEPLITSIDVEQTPSTPYQKTVPTILIVVSPSSGNWFLLIQKFKILFRLSFTMALGWSYHWYSCCFFYRFLYLGLLFFSVIVSSYSRLIIKQKKEYFSRCFKHLQRRPSITNNIQQDKIIHPPNRTYKIYKAFENKQNLNGDNVHKARSLNNTNNRTSRVSPTPTSSPLNHVKHETPISVTKYLFGSGHALKTNKQ
jgi:hypothetical protein